MAPDSTVLTNRGASESPYQLDKAQTRKASSALLKHIKSEAQRKEATSTAKNLLSTSTSDPSDTPPSDVEPIWLILTTKKHIVDQKRLKSGKIPLPHSLNISPALTVCLITSDPQRPFKDTIVHPSFPPELSKRITRVIGISKLKARYKSFESRRLLLAEHDVFLADARIITSLPGTLGKIFYSGAKRPIPVKLEAHTDRTDKSKSATVPFKPKSRTETRSIVAPPQFAKEIERTLSCAQIQLSPSATTAVRVGLATMGPEELAQNIEAVVTGMVERFIPQGWRNLKAIHLKGPNTMALPVWATEELWLEEGDVLEAEEAIEAKRRASQKHTERKGREGEPRRKKKGNLLERGSNGDMSQEMILRREKLREQKRETREAGEEEEKKGKKRKGEAEGAGAGGVGDEATKVKKAKKRKAVESSGASRLEGTIHNWSKS